MNTNEIIQKAQEEFSRLGKTSANGVTGISKTEDGWAVLLEAVERKAIPDTMDILGLYELQLDTQGNLLAFDRKKLRKRGETEAG
ncbi:MAG: gas vesicle protein [Chloroflexi bacterium]|nr:gas vesicle protein [Chloroflexota bacterium]